MTKSKFSEFYLLLVLIMITAGLTGCVSTGQQREEQAIYQRLSKLERQQAVIQRENTNAQQKLNADTNIRLDNLERELKLISESVEDALSRPEEVKTIDKFEIEGIIAELEKRIQSLENSSVSKTGERKAATLKNQHKKQNQTVSTKKIKTPGAREKALYDDAYNTFKRGNFKSAKNKFNKFIKAFPKSSFKINSQFWIGECYYKTGDFAEAIIKYDEIIASHPQHPKASSAMLKQGFAFLKLGDPTDGKLILNKVIKNYPKTDQAEIARRKLKTIK